MIGGSCVPTLHAFFNLVIHIHLSCFPVPIKANDHCEVNHHLMPGDKILHHSPTKHLDWHGSDKASGKMPPSIGDTVAVALMTSRGPSKVLGF